MVWWCVCVMGKVMVFAVVDGDVGDGDSACGGGGIGGGGGIVEVG